jgi:RimJ/RimL family protein N-acetyltransferase
MSAPASATPAQAPAQAPGPAGGAGPPEPTVAAALVDGGTAWLRPLRRGETAPVLAVFDAMSRMSRARRFLVAMPRLSAVALAALADVDGHRHVAWIACVDDRPVAVARWVRVGPCHAEIAYEVADAEQGRGVATALVDAVTTVAAAQGIGRLSATVHPTNGASVALLRRLGLDLHLVDGLLEGEGDLRLMSPARVDRCRVLELSRAR